MPKFRGCAIFRTRVIRQRVSLKILVFSMETPCWSPCEGLQHGGRKPVKTSGVYFGSLKTFIHSVKLVNIRRGNSLNILATQNSKTQGGSIFSCTQHVTQKQCRCHALFYFQIKAVYRAEGRPTDICLKMTLT